LSAGFKRPWGIVPFQKINYAQSAGREWNDYLLGRASIKYHNVPFNPKCHDVACNVNKKMNRFRRSAVKSVIVVDGGFTVVVTGPEEKF
jgi:hypothetical protein